MVKIGLYINICGAVIKVNSHTMHAGSYPFCPGKEAALVIIVVSLPYTAYLCASSIVL